MQKFSLALEFNSSAINSMNTRKPNNPWQFT